MSTPTEEGTPDDLVRQAHQTADDIFSAINRALGTRCSFTDNAKAKTAAGLVVIFESIRKAALAKQATEIARLRERNNCSSCEDRTAELGRAKRERDELLAERDILRQQLAAAEANKEMLRAQVVEQQELADEASDESQEHKERLAAAESALAMAQNGLRGVCLLFGFDPADSEEITPQDVVDYVKGRLEEKDSALTAEQALREQIRAALEGLVELQLRREKCLSRPDLSPTPEDEAAAFLKAGSALALTPTDALKKHDMGLAERAWNAAIVAAGERLKRTGGVRFDASWQASETRRALEEGSDHAHL